MVRRGQTPPALSALLLALAVWLWPVGLGGMMPVGGDVTQFSMGLMAVLHRALRAGRLPLWNDLWGYGFPGVAESQMGVFYPPHLVLYGLLPTATAYTASLVLHTAWGALGAYWAARRFGVSATGSALAGFSWSASGFFLLHLPHQWGYTTGSWMPWAWGLAWPLVRGEGTRRAPFLLAVVLTLQVLPGHFQLAFITQVSLVLLGFWGAVESAAGPGRRQTVRGALFLVLALASVFPLAAAQLWPTFRLARLATTRRDFEYLSGFATAPPHLVSFVAPGLFHRSPLWRPLAWDPFHTSPEESLAYVGLVPLFLALGAIRAGFRKDAGVRTLVLLALATLVLSLGPYIPGFHLFIHLPGFSFFRAPARWTLATSLALALLAGRGFDSLTCWPRPGRSLARFVIVAALAPLLALAVVELGLRSTERPEWPLVAQNYNRAFRALPWRGDPDFPALAAAARQPQAGLRVAQGLARGAVRVSSPGGPRFDRERVQIYRHELTETAVLLVALGAVAPLLVRPRAGRAALVVLTVLDLWALGRHRAIDLAPIRPLRAQSPLLDRLASLPRGTRTADPLGNLAMSAGANPVAAYRTLDLPALGPLTNLAQAPPGGLERGRTIGAALRVAGARIRVFDPFESRRLAREVPDWTVWDTLEPVHDPALAGWLLGVPWVSEQGPWASTFVIGTLRAPTAEAWLVPVNGPKTSEILESWSGDPAAILELFQAAAPLGLRRLTPERFVVPVRAEGSAVVIVSQLADPQWRGGWSGPDGERSAAIQAVFRRPREGGWQAVRVPGPGSWTLRLEYSGRDVSEGLAVSALAWLAGLVAYLRWGHGPAVTPNEGGRT